MKGKLSYYNMKTVKHVHVDLVRGDSRNSILQLISDLHAPVQPQLTYLPLTLCENITYQKKLDRLNEKSDGYVYSQKAASHLSSNSALVVDELVGFLEHTGTRLHRDGDLRRLHIKHRDISLSYDEQGIITRGAGKGLDVLEYLACNLAQDIAIVLRTDDQKLIYDYDCSMHEKTPKNPITGVNEHIGRDLKDIHKESRTLGRILPYVISLVDERLHKNQLDLLTVDLRGANKYSNGKQEIRRYERDYLVPLKLGILAYADVHYQDVNETTSPYEGGCCIEVQDIHREYQLERLRPLEEYEGGEF